MIKHSTQSVWNLLPGSAVRMGLLCAISLLATAAHAEEVLSTSLEQLEKQVASAAAGQVIVLQDGVYEGARCRLAGNGTANQPIVIRAATRGKVRVRSAVSIQGEYVTLDGIHFEQNGYVQIKGTGIRLTRCEMTDVRQGRWIRVHADSRLLEIDHCRFANKTINQTNSSNCQLLQIVVRNQHEKHHIHHNHFLDIPKGKTSNGYETLQLITEGNPFNPEPGDCGTVIEHNLFERCNGESEVISVKSNGNILRANTFRNCLGGLVLRHGHGNVVTQCFFIGDEEPRAGGVRMQGRDQVVTNNSFLSLRAYGVAMMDGTPDNLYVRTERALVAFNTFVDCDPALAVGVTHPKHPDGTPPKNCRIANNLFYFQKRDPDSQMRTVRLINDDKPEDWSWEGNITNGDLNMPPHEGIEKRPLSLSVLPSGIAVPSSTDTELPPAAGHYPEITTDILGQTRTQPKSTGCVEQGTQPPSAGALLPQQVGPSAAAMEVPTR